MDRCGKKKMRVPNETYGLPTKIYRTFYTRYKEHTITITREYSNDVLNTGHACRGTTNELKIAKIEEKGKYLSVLEKYLIYEISKKQITHEW
jgi:hypothetical protein